MGLRDFYTLFTGSSGKALFVLIGGRHTNDISMFVKIALNL